jgi:hypothetical protein
MLALLGCTPAPPVDRDPDPVGPPAFVTPMDPPTGWVASCRPDADLEIASLTVTPSDFWRATVEVALTRPADVAVECTLASDPAEVHLVEGRGADRYAWELGGLLGGEDYDCEAAAVCPTALGPNAHATMTTPPTPSWVPTATPTFDADLRMTGIYTLTNAQPDCTGGPDRDQWLVLWDPLGRPRWVYALPPHLNMGIEARFHGDDLIVWGGGDSPYGAPAEVDLFDGQRLKTVVPDADGAIFNHDGKMVPDGRMLTNAATDEHPWASFRLDLVDPGTGEDQWTYRSDQAIDQGALSPDNPAGPADPWHLNWLDLVGDTVVASLCHAREIVGIDVPSSRVGWKFGKAGDFALVDEDGHDLDWTWFPQCQHGLEYDGRSLLVYDNGTENGWSRAIEYDLDLEARIATRTWWWTEAGWYETSLGDVDWLTADHRRVLVTEAHPECFSPSPDAVSQILEVDRDTDDVVHRLVFDDPETSTYRAERIGGCDVFANAAYCQELADRRVLLEPRFER